ncbi:MAG: nucleotide exchange factor GrpE [Rhodospirillaceae bacterium]|nr:nucleotide exchange factor GrpE [Rhodospirillaceae bacterium]
MSEDTENEQPEEEQTADNVEPEQTPADEEDDAVPQEGADEPLMGPEASDDELELLQGGDGLAELQDVIADLNDKLLRAVAETENVRRRAQRDKEDASKYAIQSFAAEMVSVADNLGRALDSVDSTTRDSDEAVDNLCTGVEMTQRELLNTFERVGIKLIEAEGQRFDHNLHEAMFEMEAPDKPTGTVVQVIQAGYTIRDRLLRPAKVGVSKGGPKAAPEDAAQPPESDATTDESEGAAKAYEAPNQTGSQLDEEL